MHHADARKAQFHWDDPLLINNQLSDEERMVRDAAASYCQDKLKPRVAPASARLIHISAPAGLPNDPTL